MSLKRLAALACVLALLAAPVAQAQDIPTWIEILQGEDPAAREDAAANLVQAGAEAVEPLLGVLAGRGPGAEAARQALLAIGAQLGTGIVLTLPNGVQPPARWFVVPAGADPAALLAERDDGALEILGIPPGRYDVYWVPREAAADEPLIVAQNATVGAEGASLVEVNAAVLQPTPPAEAEPAVEEAAPAEPEMPAEEGAATGQAAAPAPTLPADSGSLVALLGDPDPAVRDAAAAALQQDPANRLDALPALFELVANRDASLEAKGAARAVLRGLGEGLDTAVLPEIPDGVPNPYRWFVTPAGAAPSAWVAESEGGTLKPLAVPPGSYDLYWAQEEEHLERPLRIAQSVEVGGSGVTDVAVGAGARIRQAFWMPPRTKQGWWGAVPTGDVPDAPVNWSRSNKGILLLPPGTWDFYWLEGKDATPQRFADAVEIAPGAIETVAADTGVQLVTATWVPPRDQTAGWWGAVPAGGDPQATVSRTNTADVLLLPPGTYDVYWAEEGDAKRPHLLAAGVAVEPGALAPVAADTGVALETADWVAPRDEKTGWWGAVRAGEDPARPLSQTAADVPLLLPPGTYDIVWAQDKAAAEHPLVLAAGVEVPPGQLISVQADSGIQVRRAKGVKQLSKKQGWWGVVAHGEPPTTRMAEWRGRSDQPLLLPPGHYDVYWKQDQKSEPRRIAEDVAVEVGKLVEVEVKPQ